MNAIKFLIKEHDRVRRTFAKIDEKARYETKLNLFENLCQDLIVHENMEQKTWYPHFRNNSKIKSEVRHLLTEEKHAEKAIKSFKNVKTESEWEKKFAKFREDVEHHASEEENDLFPNVAEIFNDKELKEIGAEMRAFKTKVLGKAKSKKKH